MKILYTNPTGTEAVRIRNSVSVDPLTLTTTDSNLWSDPNNKFIPPRRTDYTSQVKFLVDAYNGKTETGSLLVRTIADFRTSAISGGGGATITAKRRKEQIWIDSFLAYNELHSILFSESVLEGELTGKVLFYLQPEEDQIAVRLIHWVGSQYVVNTNPLDYADVQSVTINKGKPDQVFLAPEEVVYCKLGGSRQYVNDCPPRLALCLYEIQAADYAAKDLRLLNSKYAGSFLHFETKTGDESEDLVRLLASSNFRPGSALATPAKPSFIHPSADSFGLLEKEIAISVERISAITGVSAHVLGIFSSTASGREPSSLNASLIAATQTERTVWKTKLKELVQKAMRMADPSLRWQDVSVELPIPSNTVLADLAGPYLSLYQAGVISRQTLVDLVPETSDAQEQQRIALEQPEEKPEATIEEQPEEVLPTMIEAMPQLMKVK